MALLQPLPLEPAWESVLAHAAGRRVEPQALALMVARLSRRYNGEGGQIAAGDEILARLLFWFARDIHKVALPIAELALLGALPERLRILDLGAGVGATSFGALRAFAHPDILSHCARRPERLDAIDRNPAALAAMQRLAVEAKRAGLIAGLDVLETSVADFCNAASLGRRDGEPYDLVLVGSALVEATQSLDTAQNRGEATAELIAEIIRATRLAADGALIVIEPATRTATRALHHARDHLARRGLWIFAPCTHQSACPMLERERDWCHEDLPVDLPPWLWSVARDAGLRWEGLTFSYLVVRRDGTRSVRDTVLRGLPARLVSAPRETKGKCEAFACGPFAGTSHGRRVIQLARDAKRVERSETLAAWSRGDIVAIQQHALVRQDAGRPIRLTPSEIERRSAMLR